MKTWILFAAFFALVSFNSCDYSASNYPSTESAVQASPADAQMAAIQQKLAEKQNSGEITEEQAAALLLLIIAAIAENAGADAASSSFSGNNQVGNSGYTEDEVMDMVVDQAINPVGVIDYNY